MSESNEITIPMEDQHPKKCADKVKNTSADDQNMKAILEANAEVAPAYKNLETSLLKARNATKGDAQRTGERAKEKPKIQRVPVVLLQKDEKFKKYYQPRWISIGPIHHGNSKLRLAEKKYKPELVAKYINESGSSIEDLYKRIKDRIKDLKECFDEDVIKDYDDDTLSWMLFFDGCSILQFISSYVKRDHELKIFSIKNDQIAYAQQDLFLLENQIPFLVLKLLMEAHKDVKELKISVMEFICYNVMTPFKYKKNLEVKLETDPEPAHLLELLRLAILQHPKKDPKSRGLGRLLSHPLEKAVTLFPCKNRWPIKKLFPEGKGYGQQSFRSVQDLISAGIDLRPSESCSLTDITFTSLCFAGWLRLPPITVDDSTGPRFLNLIAYEMCPDNFRTNYEVTSYISFLDSLIDYPADVKELRSAHILHNLLGCDKEVAQLFNEIAVDLAPNLEVYKEEIDRIQSHYKSKWRTWMAQVYHDHFSSPWTIVAFLAAAVALGMSGIQTWYTMHPSASN